MSIRAKLLHRPVFPLAKRGLGFWAILQSLPGAPSFAQSSALKTTTRFFPGGFLLTLLSCLEAELSFLEGPGRTGYFAR